VFFPSRIAWQWASHLGSVLLRQGETRSKRGQRLGREWNMVQRWRGDDFWGRCHWRRRRIRCGLWGRLLWIWQFGESHVEGDREVLEGCNLELFWIVSIQLHYIEKGEIYILRQSSVSSFFPKCLFSWKKVVVIVAAEDVEESGLSFCLSFCFSSIWERDIVFFIWVRGKSYFPLCDKKVSEWLKTFEALILSYR